MVLENNLTDFSRNAMSSSVTPSFDNLFVGYVKVKCICLTLMYIHHIILYLKYIIDIFVIWIDS